MIQGGAEIFSNSGLCVCWAWAAEDAAVAEWEGRGGWVADGGYAALVPCTAEDGWIGGEEVDGGLGGGGFHDEFSFQILATKNTKVTKVDCERG